MSSISEIDKFEKRLNQLEKSADELNQTTQVSFAELFTHSFMQKYTSFISFNDLLKAGGFIVKSQEDFRKIPEDEFDKHIASTTQFSTWKEMLNAAGKQYALNKLKF